MSRRRRRNNRRPKIQPSQVGGAAMSVGGNRIPQPMINTKPYRCTLRAMLTGGNVVPATTTGYSYLTITSSLFSSASAYPQLAALFMQMRPIGCRAIVTFNRATGTTDNPRVAFIPTPDGQAVGNLGMNLSTFESPTGQAFTGGPGAQIGFKFKPFISVAAFNTVANGYVVMPAPRVSIRSVPLIYFGDILFYTPGVLLTSVTQYVQIQLEFDIEFGLLRTDLVA